MLAPVISTRAPIQAARHPNTLDVIVRLVLPMAPALHLSKQWTALTIPTSICLLMAEILALGNVQIALNEA